VVKQTSISGAPLDISHDSLHCSAEKPAIHAVGVRHFFTVLLASFQSHARNTITNASDVLALSVADAQSQIAVSVTGVVTMAETNSDWAGQFFVQDSSGGIFVASHFNPPPFPGDLVQVTGVTHPGGFAPVITKPHWKKIGTAPLPAARPVSTERLMTGSEDSQRVEVSGIIRSAQPSGGRIGIELASGGFRFKAYFPTNTSIDPASLIGAKVVVRGTAAAAFNKRAWLRQFFTVTIFCPRAEDFIIEEPAPANPFAEPATSLKSIAQYRKDRPEGYQVHVKGVVTYQIKGQELFLQDNTTDGLRIKTAATNAVVPGDVVEAVGFPAVENFLPVLEDAIFRKMPEPRANLQPTNTSIADLQRGLHHAAFVCLRGRLLDRLVKGLGADMNQPGIQTTLIIQASNTVFAAEKETSEPNTFLSAIPIGSIVEVRGICLLDSGGDGSVKSFRVVLPTSHDVQIIKKPDWLTPRHLIITLVSVVLILVLAIAWTIWVSNKNSTLKSLVQEKETAQHELQQAHDQLEERVKERTAQLKVEMTARKESELQFRAVLTERTRLAQELHDTLEQTLTGIALQQDLVASQFDKNPESATHHLKLARNLMRQSQEDLHRSVWGLRSRAEEDFNLTSALETSAAQLTEDAGIRLEANAIGAPPVLSEIFDENLLRIGQEAVTNAVKHSRATRIKIQWQFTPQQVNLTVSDNGIGFQPETCSGPKDGHFGLLGIRERTERLGGRLSIASTPGVGTAIGVEIPVSAPNGHSPSSVSVLNHEVSS